MGKSSQTPTNNAIALLVVPMGQQGSAPLEDFSELVHDSIFSSTYVM